MNPKISVLTLWRETFEGMVGDGTWFADSEPNTGILGTISKLTAERASRKGCGNSTIAAHVIHATYYMKERIAAYKGEEFEADWEGSWKEQLVDEARWDQVRAELKEKYEEMTQFLERPQMYESQDAVTGAMANVCHAAYHLGAIRQLIAT